MNNPGYYIWSEEVEKKGEVLEPPAGGEFSTVEKPQTTDAVCEKDKLEFLQKMQLLEKHHRISIKYIAFFVIDICLLIGLYYSTIKLPFYVLLTFSTIFTIYYFRSDQKPPLPINELLELKDRVLKGEFGTQDDLNLINKNIFIFRKRISRARQNRLLQPRKPNP